jgi:hypothetical protein
MVLDEACGAAGVEFDGDRALHVADEWVSALDAAVKDTYTDTGTARATPRPFRGDPERPAAGELNLS